MYSTPQAYPTQYGRCHGAVRLGRYGTGRLWRRCCAIITFVMALHKRGPSMNLIHPGRTEIQTQDLLGERCRPRRGLNGLITANQTLMWIDLKQIPNNLSGHGGFFPVFSVKSKAHCGSRAPPTRHAIKVESEYAVLPKHFTNVDLEQYLRHKYRLSKLGDHSKDTTTNKMVQLNHPADC